MALHVFLTSELEECFYGLLNDTVSSSNHIEWNDKIINE
jgi:hypothetical protein